MSQSLHEVKKELLNSVRLNDASEFRKWALLGKEKFQFDINLKDFIYFLKPSGNPKKFRPLLEVACFFGSDKVVEEILKTFKDDVDLNNGVSKPIYRACRHGHIKCVKILLNHPKLDLKAESQKKKTTLYAAGKCGNFEIYKLIMKKCEEKEIDPLAYMDGEYNVFQGACRGGNYEIFSDLINRKRLRVNFSRNISPLSESCRSGNYKIFSELSKRNDISTFYGNTTPLYSACLSGNYKIFKELLCEGLHDVETLKSTQLYAAAVGGNVKIFKEILKDKFSYDSFTINKGEPTPLYGACLNGHIEIVKILLNRFDIDINKGINSPLYAAARGGHLDIVNLLLEREEIDLKAGNNSPLCGACYHSKDYPIFQRLMNEKGIDINHGESYGNALYVSCYFNNIKVVKELLKCKEIDVNKGKCTPLFVAIQNGHFDVVKLLCSNNKILINKGFFSSVETSPIVKAVARGYYDIANYLLSFPDIDINRGYTTALYESIFSDFYNEDFIINVLLKRKDIDINKGIRTAFYASCKVPKCNLFKTFYNDKNLKINQGNYSPFGGVCMLKEGGNEIFDILINDERVDINRGEHSPLYLACQNGRKDFVEKLLSRDDIKVNLAGENSSSFFHQTPLAIAARNGHVEIVKMLLNHKDIKLTTSNNHRSELYVSVLGENMECFKLLLNAKGVDVTSGLFSPLSGACEIKEVEMVRLLLEKEEVVKSINVVDKYKTTVLYRAVSWTYPDDKRVLEIVKMLLEKNADINKGGAVFSCVQYGHRNVFKEFMKRKEFNVNEHNSKGLSLIGLAIGSKFDDFADDLLSCKDLKINSYQSDNYKGGDILSPVFRCCERNNLYVLKKLLKRDGVDVNPFFVCRIRGNVKISALHRAIHYGSVELVKLMLSKTKEIEKSLNFGEWVPLGKACERSNVEIVKMMLSHPKMNANAGYFSTGDGKRKLARNSLACCKGNSDRNDEIYKMLLARDDIDIYSGIFGPLYYLCQHNKPHLLKLLLKKGLKEEYINRLTEGFSALDRAIRSGSIECVKILLELDEINVNRGYGALYKSIFYNQREIFDILMRRDDIDIDRGRNPLFAFGKKVPYVKSSEKIYFLHQLFKRKDIKVVLKKGNFLTSPCEYNSFKFVREVLRILPDEYCDLFPKALEAACKKEHKDIVILFCLRKIKFNVDKMIKLCDNEEIKKLLSFATHPKTRNAFLSKYGRQRKYDIGEYLDRDYFRCALIISNNKYENLKDLKEMNCTNIKSTLEEVKFDYVSMHNNVDLEDFNDEIDLFLATLMEKIGDDEHKFKTIKIFVYFYGYTLEKSNEFYLLPIDFRKNHTKSLPIFSVNIRRFSAITFCNSDSFIVNILDSRFCKELENEKVVIGSLSVPKVDQNVTIRGFSKDDLPKKKGVKEEDEMIFKPTRENKILVFSQIPKVLIDEKDNNVFVNALSTELLKKGLFSDLLLNIRNITTQKTESRVFPNWRFNVAVPLEWFGLGKMESKLEENESVLKKELMKKRKERKEIEELISLAKDRINENRRENLSVFEKRVMGLTPFSFKAGILHASESIMSNNHVEKKIITQKSSYDDKIVFQKNIIIENDIISVDPKMAIQRDNCCCVQFSPSLFMEERLIYFEMYIENMKKYEKVVVIPEIAIGFAKSAFKDGMVGEFDETIGFSNDGIICNFWKMFKNAVNYTDKDTVGCGMNLISGELFFTINGYIVLSDYEINCFEKNEMMKYLPTITFFSNSIKVKPIFSNFKFDLEHNKMFLFQKIPSQIVFTKGYEFNDLDKFATILNEGDIYCRTSRRCTRHSISCVQLSLDSTLRDCKEEVYYFEILNDYVCKNESIRIGFCSKAIVGHEGKKFNQSVMYCDDGTIGSRDDHSKFSPWRKGNIHYIGMGWVKKTGLIFFTHNGIVSDKFYKYDFKKYGKIFLPTIISITRCCNFRFVIKLHKKQLKFNNFGQHSFIHKADLNSIVLYTWLKKIKVEIPKDLEKNVEASSGGTSFQKKGNVGNGWNSLIRLIPSQVEKFVSFKFIVNKTHRDQSGLFMGLIGSDHNEKSFWNAASTAFGKGGIVKDAKIHAKEHANGYLSESSTYEMIIDKENDKFIVLKEGLFYGESTKKPSSFKAPIAIGIFMFYPLNKVTIMNVSYNRKEIPKANIEKNVKKDVVVDSPVTKNEFKGENIIVKRTKLGHMNRREIKNKKDLEEIDVKIRNLLFTCIKTRNFNLFKEIFEKEEKEEILLKYSKNGPSSLSLRCIHDESRETSNYETHLIYTNMLTFACFCENYDVINYLLRKQYCEINAGANKRVSPLYISCLLKNYELCKRIISLKGIEIASGYGNALLKACKSDNFWMVREFMKHCPSKLTHLFEEPFFYVCKNTKNLNIIILFLMRFLPFYKKLKNFKRFEDKNVLNIIKEFLQNASKFRHKYQQIEKYNFGVRIRTFYKVALIVGMKNYNGLSNLETSINDVNSVEVMLKEKMKYQKVKKVIDVTYKELVKQIDAFMKEIKHDCSLEKQKYRTLLFTLYYSGHGITSQSESFILPKDFKNENLKTMTNMLSTSLLQKKIENISNNIDTVGLIVLDACRTSVDEKIKTKSKQSITKKEEEEVQSSNVKNDMIYVFSTDPNCPAYDSSFGKVKSTNSPFTDIVLRSFPLRDKFESVMMEVQKGVMKATANNQKCWWRSTLPYAISLNGVNEDVKYSTDKDEAYLDSDEYMKKLKREYESLKVKLKVIQMKEDGIKDTSNGDELKSEKKVIKGGKGKKKKKKKKGMKRKVPEPKTPLHQDSPGFRNLILGAKQKNVL